MIATDGKPTIANLRELPDELLSERELALRRGEVGVVRLYVSGDQLWMVDRFNERRRVLIVAASR